MIDITKYQRPFLLFGNTNLIKTKTDLFSLEISNYHLYSKKKYTCEGLSEAGSILNNRFYCKSILYTEDSFKLHGIKEV